MELTTNNTPSYLHAVASGEFVLRNAEEQFMDLLDSVVDTGADRVLLDGRQVTGNLDVLDRYVYGEFVALAAARLPKNVVPTPPKFAYVLTHPVLDPDRLGETVARNRGMSLRAFDNKDEALEWLVSEDR
ncbi:MAG TPA: hypothetical protein VGC44_04395 [Longimicrobiales bacterium]